MNDSNSDNKDIVEADAVVSESNADVNKVEEVKEVKKTAKAKKEVKEVKKTTKAKKAEETKEVKKPAKAKKAEEVVASEAASEKEEVNVAPYIANTKKEEVSKTSPSTSVYLSIAAGVLLAVTLTIVTFFQDEYESVVASFQSGTVADEVVSETSVATQESGPALVNNVPMPAQASYGYQSAKMNQARNNNFKQIREKNQAAYVEAKRQHDVKMAKMNESRMATFKRMNQERVDRQNKFKVMNEKVQKIQLEMQQKMKAAYDEFNAI